MKHDTMRGLVEQPPTTLSKLISERLNDFFEAEAAPILKTEKFQNFRRLLSLVCTTESFSTAS
jgi:hypothetical protein